jgi:hypothetical protein
MKCFSSRGIHQRSVIPTLSTRLGDENPLFRSPNRSGDREGAVKVDYLGVQKKNFRAI